MPTSTNGDTKKRDLSDLVLEFRGDRLTLPEGMTHDEAIDVIKRRQVEDESEVGVNETVRCFPMDGAVAFAKVLKERFGWTTLVPTRNFFGTQPPMIVGVEVGFNKVEQIPWGACTVPKIEGKISTGFRLLDDLPVFAISAAVKRKHEHLVAEIANEVRRVAREESIYRGQAVKINLRDNDGDRITDFGPEFAPRFLDIDSIRVEEIVYSVETERMLQVNVFNPVEHTDLCRRYNIPLKRGILLEGQFGTGKTLTADLLAKKCVENGWTFLYLEDARDLDTALGFAEMYSPCVLFAEDIDKVLKGDRNANMDKLFNRMDGLEGKNREVMVVLTTNTVGAIHRGFLRPGRIDTIIEITPPDGVAISKLVKLYGRDDQGNTIVSAGDEDIANALRKIKGVNAAFIREVVERAKLAALGVGETLDITAEALELAADSLKSHIKLLYPDLASGNPLELDGYEEVDPMKMATDLLLDRVVYEFLDKLVDPKVVHKMLMKKAPKHCGFPSAN